MIEEREVERGGEWGGWLCTWTRLSVVVVEAHLSGLF